jgi:hypothetical protein
VLLELESAALPLLVLEMSTVVWPSGVLITLRDEPLAGTGTDWPLTVTWLDVVPFVVELLLTTLVDEPLLSAVVGCAGLLGEEGAVPVLAWPVLTCRAAWELPLPEVGAEAAWAFLACKIAPTNATTAMNIKVPASSRLLPLRDKFKATLLSTIPKPKTFF